MAVFENFPYTNLHNLNLDWIIKMIRELNNKFDEAISAKIKFANPIEWDITKQYETLTIVIDDNKAYLSMQPVPSGIAINNTEYWQNIFDMSELVQMQEDYEQEMTDKFNDLKDQVEDDIQDLETDLSAEINRVDSESVKNNSVKKMLYLGDSYSTFFSNQLFNYVRDNIGIPTANIHNLAASGASFFDASNSYLMQLQSYTGNKTEITDILVVGGINDAQLAFDNYTFAYPNVTSMTTAIDTFVNYARTNYPNAELHIAYVGGCLPTSSMYSTYHPAKSQEWALWGYTVYAAEHGFRVLDRTWNAIHGSIMNYNSDGIHPSSAYGVPAIGASICDAFNNRINNTNRPTIITIMIPTGVTYNVHITAFKRVINDMLELVIPDGYIQIKPNEQLPNDFVDIVDMGINSSNQGMDCLIRNPIYMQCTVALSGFNGMSAQKQVPAELRFQDGKIAIKLFNIDASGNYVTVTAGSFSAITFLSLQPILLPIWQVN